MSTDVRRLDPVFDFAACESSVLLHQDQAELRIDGHKYTGNAEVRLDLSPRAGIHLYGRFQGISSAVAWNVLTDPATVSSFSFNGCRVEGFLLGIPGDATAHEKTVKWCPKSEPIIGVGDESTQMKSVVFHLFNFVDLIGTRRSIEQSGNATTAIEHVNLTCGKWKAELRSLSSTGDSFKSLNREGGYRLTHIGCLEKTDDTPFSGKDANESLNALRFFLSFAKGGWCEPTCAVGFDESGRRIWQSWSSPREPWRTPQSWFDPHNSSQLAALFPGFMKRTADANWREALREVTYWYLNANHSSRGIDVGIILTQAAIERLSYEYAVRDKRLLAADGFKALRASDKFRLLFSSLEIPLAIPAETPELKKLASRSQSNWLDAPHALTEIRNSLVHPEHGKHGQLSSAYHEAWNLGLWYLEMGILAICGYSGTYGNRLRQRWVGQVEDVPWRK